MENWRFLNFCTMFFGVHFVVDWPFLSLFIFIFIEVFPYEVSCNVWSVLLFYWRKLVYAGWFLNFFHWLYKMGKILKQFVSDALHTTGRHSWTLMKQPRAVQTEVALLQCCGAVLCCSTNFTSADTLTRNQELDLYWSLKMSVNSTAHSSVSVGKHPAHSHWHQGRHSAWAAARKCKDSFSRPGSVGAAHSLWYICKLINCLPWPPATIPPANDRDFPL